MKRKQMKTECKQCVCGIAEVDCEYHRPEEDVTEKAKAFWAEWQKDIYEDLGIKPIATYIGPPPDFKSIKQLQDEMDEIMKNIKESMEFFAMPICFLDKK